MTSTQILQNSIYDLDLNNHELNHQATSHENGSTLQSNDEAQKHPLGIKPSGNAFTSTKNLHYALGTLVLLPDAMLLLLLEYLDHQALVNLGATCKALFAYTTHDQLWRDIVTSDPEHLPSWRGSWRASCRGLASSKLPRIDCSSLFSDALYRPFQCSQTPLEPFIANIPPRNQIARLSDLTPSDFNEKWTDLPFILTEPVKTWKAYKDWDEKVLLQRFADTVFRAEAVDWPLRTYVDYMNNTQDESPLYLFDRGFAEKMKLRTGRNEDYEPPPCFGEDLFMLLGDHRPDHQWLIVGPRRSGSTFHKDPNATSAWNAVIRGSKYWIMFPNSVIPPGVYMSEDQSEVTSPLSIAEWLLSFHDEARQTLGCVEGICGAGEVLHVPSGWWHLVVNLEPSIAITQNFVPKAHLRAAVNFLKNKAGQVSGFKDDVQDPHALFMEKLEQAHPDLYASIQASTDRKRKWKDVVENDVEEDTNRGGFSFGFGSDIDEEEIP